MELEALDHVALTATDAARSVRWYHTSCSAPPRPPGGVGRQRLDVAKVDLHARPDGHLVEITSYEVTRG